MIGRKVYGWVGSGKPLAHTKCHPICGYTTTLSYIRKKIPLPQQGGITHTFRRLAPSSQCILHKVVTVTFSTKECALVLSLPSHSLICVNHAKKKNINKNKEKVENPVFSVRFFDLISCVRLEIRFVVENTHFPTEIVAEKPQADKKAKIASVVKSH